ncbi:hypothetical protein [Mucilaginibacter auburnensis]|nr:hypothetical protein [Mucilaginibacter auburnensis]
MSLRIVLVFLWLLASLATHAQSKFKVIPLPLKLNDVNQEFSGMARLGDRIYILPQYGYHKETALDGEFEMYSIKADSISRVLAGADTVITAYRTLKVRGLEKLPAEVKQMYQGFETLTFVGQYAYIAIETADIAANCYLIRGVVDTANNEILIDAQRYVTLVRPSYISNAGFESITWLPKEDKLIAFYEFNADAKGNFAYLIDTSLTQLPKKVKTPFLYFRNTDAATAADGSIYAINYHWDGDYDKYLNNNFVNNPERDIKHAIPSLKSKLDHDPQYLKGNTFARIIRLKNYRKNKWQEVAVFDGFKNNWEGVTLFNKGALVITDANRSSKQVTQLVYIEF